MKRRRMVATAAGLAGDDAAPSPGFGLVAGRGGTRDRIMKPTRKPGYITALGILTAMLAAADVALSVARPESKLAPAVIGRLDHLAAHGLVDEPVALIIQTWGTPDQSDRSLVGDFGGRTGEPFRSIHGFAAEVPARNVLDLAASSRVRRVSYDWPVRPHLDQDIAVEDPEAALPEDRGDPGFTGRGVTVAILDSGVSPSPHFGPDASVIMTEIDFTEPDSQLRDPFGHGTHMAGIVAGIGEDPDYPEEGGGFLGIALGARIVSLKVIGYEGLGRTSDVLAGVDWVIRNHEARNIRVLLLPLGHPVDESYMTDPLCQALEMAWEAGVVVVVSAGNFGGYGYATITSPGNDPHVITVGASEDWSTPETSDDLVAPFSSRGPTAFDGVIKPDLIAPGTAIVSTRARGSHIDALFPDDAAGSHADMTAPDPEGVSEGSVVSLSGTSMAAATVAGAAAVLLEQDPEATPDDIKARLMIGARKIHDAIVARGAGILDIPVSLGIGEIGVVAQRARSPHVLVVEGDDGSRSIQIQEIGSAWGDPFTWLSPEIWGDTGLWGVSDLWTGASIWEDGMNWGPLAEGSENQMAIWGFR
jgi:serine protease AprX